MLTAFNLSVGLHCLNVIALTYYIIISCQNNWEQFDFFLFFFYIRLHLSELVFFESLEFSHCFSEIECSDPFKVPSFFVTER